MMNLKTGTYSINQSWTEGKYTTMSPDKILHIIGGGEIGGAEQHVLNLLENLDRKLFLPVLACLVEGPFAEAARSKGIQTQTFAMRHPLDLSPLPQLVQWTRAQNVKLIHCHGARANLLGRLAARFLKIPNLSTVHSSLAHDYLSPFAAWLALLLDRLTLPLSNGQIAVSSYLARELAARGSRQVKVIYNGYPVLPPYDHLQERQEFRRQWNIPFEAQVLGTIARFHPAKGHHTLVEAAKLLQGQFPGLHLLLIGEGPLKETIRESLDTLKIPYTLTGFLQDAYRALPAMDIFILPSIHEGMGLVLLEAMQRCTPIVASRTGGIPELVRSEKDGLLVPPGEPEALAHACTRILTQPGLAAKLTQSAQDRWPEFSLEVMLKETQALYTSLLHSPSSGLFPEP